MSDYRVFRICRVGGQVAFWLLIVSTLFAGGLTWLVADDDAEAQTALIGFPSGVSAQDATAVTHTLEPGSAFADASVISRETSSSLPDSFPTFAQISLACALLFIVAALGEALLIRRRPRRYVTAVIPFLVLVILWYATPGARASIDLDPEVAFIFVLTAIAVREVWFRWAAPTLSAPPKAPAPEDP